MSYRSEAVKKWRQNTKNRFIQAMGGCCQICGYNRCNDALDLHHLNPKQKEFSFGKIIANPTSWSKIIIELRKCVLLCSNCHREVHDNITDIPISAKKFDENYSVYIEVKVKQFDPCPVCGKPKLTSHKVCSKICRAISKRKIDWDSIDLISLYKEKSVARISEEIGVSCTVIVKKLRKLGITPYSHKRTIGGKAVEVGLAPTGVLSESPV